MENVCKWVVRKTIFKNHFDNSSNDFDDGTSLFPWFSVSTIMHRSATLTLLASKRLHWSSFYCVREQLKRWSWNCKTSYGVWQQSCRANNLTARGYGRSSFSASIRRRRLLVLLQLLQQLGSMIFAYSREPIVPTSPVPSSPSTRRALFTYIFYYCPLKRWQYCFQVSFFSVNAIIHEPLHLAWWNFAQTCTLTTARSLLNIKVRGQRTKSHVFCAFLSALYPRAVLSLERGCYLFDIKLYMKYTQKKKWRKTD